MKFSEKIKTLSLFEYQGVGKVFVTGCAASKYVQFYPAEFSIGTRVFIKSKAVKGILESVVIKKIKVNKSDLRTKVQPAIFYVDTLNRVWDEAELIDQSSAQSLVENRLDLINKFKLDLEACIRNQLA